MLKINLCKIHTIILILTSILLHIIQAIRGMNLLVEILSKIIHNKNFIKAGEFKTRKKFPNLPKF